MSDPRVTWAGVIVRLSDGTIVATEFPSGFITADVHTLRPWDPGSKNQTQDEVRITVQGNGRIWTEGEDVARGRVVRDDELPPARYVRRDGSEFEVTADRRVLEIEP